MNELISELAAIQADLELKNERIQHVEKSVRGFGELLSDPRVKLPQDLQNKVKLMLLDARMMGLY